VLGAELTQGAERGCALCFTRHGPDLSHERDRWARVRWIDVQQVQRDEQPAGKGGAERARAVPQVDEHDPAGAAEQQAPGSGRSHPAAAQSQSQAEHDNRQGEVQPVVE
jgi:hypothetical protein